MLAIRPEIKRRLSKLSINGGESRDQLLLPPVPNADLAAIESDRCQPAVQAELPEERALSETVLVHEHSPVGGAANDGSATIIVLDEMNKIRIVGPGNLEAALTVPDKVRADIRQEQGG